MLVDTLVKIDTVFVEKASDLITQNEMLQQIETIHNFYDHYLTSLLWIFGLGVTVAGVIVPYILQWYQRTQLRNELKEELLKEFTDRIVDISNDLEKNIDLKIETKQYENKFQLYSIAAAIAKENYKHNMAIKYYVLNAFVVIKLNKWDELINIINELKEYNKDHYEINIKDNEFREGTENRVLFRELTSSVEADSSNLIHVENLIEAIRGIIDTHIYKKKTKNP